jgi:hypothetical protein
MIKESREAKSFNRALEKAISKGELLEMTMIESVEDNRRVCRYAVEATLDESGYQRLIDYHVVGGRYEAARIYADRAKERLNIAIQVPALNVVSFAEAKNEKARKAKSLQSAVIRRMRRGAILQGCR